MHAIFRREGRAEAAIPVRAGPGALVTELNCRTIGLVSGRHLSLSSHVESSLVLYSNGVVHDKAFADGATMNARLDAEAGEGSDWAHLSDAGSLRARTPVCPAKSCLCAVFQYEQSDLDDRKSPVHQCAVVVDVI